MLLLSQLTISSVVSVEWYVTKERLHIVWENKLFIIFWFWLFYLQKRGGEEGRVWRKEGVEKRGVEEGGMEEVRERSGRRRREREREEEGRI